MKPIVLATTVLASGVSAAAAQDCNIPPAYTNQVVVEDGDLRIRYATDRSTYGPTDDVLIYLVVENIGATTFSTNWGIDPQDGHFILRPGFETFAECCADEQAFAANVLLYHPEVIHFSIDITGPTSRSPTTWGRVKALYR